MKTRFRLLEIVAIKAHPGWIGKVIMIETFAKRYLLDCFPGALPGYIYYKHPSGYGIECEVEANWFGESELRRATDEEKGR